jgi:hypothetical protein
VTIFWDQEGILLTDYLPKGQTIKAKYYSFLLVLPKDTLKEKRRGEAPNGVLSFMDNAPAHRGPATQKKKLAYLCFQSLENPLYSPDLATLDYHLVNELKQQLKGRHFPSYTGVQFSSPDLVGRVIF